MILAAAKNIGAHGANVLHDNGTPSDPHGNLSGAEWPVVLLPFEVGVAER